MWLRAGLWLLLFARLAATQEPDSTPRAPGATVTGVVHDSIARRPLAGAVVQLATAGSAVRFGRTVVSDSLGWFTFEDVPDGRYRVGFFHPMLDSLGLEPTLREVVVAGRRPVSVDLAIPSPARFRAAICGPQSEPSAGSVIMGIVRNATDRSPAAGVTVTGEWLELSFTKAGIVRRNPRLAATTGENGWFALCDVPSPGTMALLASRGADSTDRIEVQVPREGFLRRELYLGTARIVVTGDTLGLTRTLAPPPRRLRFGDGRLHGTVVAGDGGQALGGAQVSVADGPRTLTNDRGEWTLVEAPAGTRVLEVRAVGFYPERRPVDVLADAAPVHVTLSTISAVLDTVLVTATRLGDPNRSGFAARRRSGPGRYLSALDIVRRQPTVTSDLLRIVPGMFLETDGIETRILMRGTFEERCSPAIYLNGHYLSGVIAGDLDTMVRPSEIVGIEVYAGVAVPAEFQPGLSGCGSIVFWTK